MSIQPMSELAHAMPIRRRATTMRVAGPIGLAVLAGLCGSVVSKPAEAVQRSRNLNASCARPVSIACI
jgi:hypothetical protein